MNKRKILQIIFLAIVIFSGYQLFLRVKGDLDFKKVQEEIQTVKMSTSTDVDSKQAEIEEFNVLKKDNPNLVAWISIPGTEIDFPVVQGKDNNFYLNHDYKGSYNVYGAPYLDKDNDDSFNDQNSTIYGHNIRGERIFGKLLNYQDPNYLKNAPTIKLLTAEGKKSYEIRAVYIADPYDNYRSKNYEGDSWKKFTDRWSEKNILKFQIPSKEDKILTLQTCVKNDRRLVIHALKSD